MLDHVSGIIKSAIREEHAPAEPKASSPGAATAFAQALANLMVGYSRPVRGIETRTYWDSLCAGPIALQPEIAIAAIGVASFVFREFMPSPSQIRDVARARFTAVEVELARKHKAKTYEQIADDIETQRRQAQWYAKHERKETLQLEDEAIPKWHRELSQKLERKEMTRGDYARALMKGYGIDG